MATKELITVIEAKFLEALPSIRVSLSRIRHST